MSANFANMKSTQTLVPVELVDEEKSETILCAHKMQALELGRTIEEISSRRLQLCMFWRSLASGGTFQRGARVFVFLAIRSDSLRPKDATSRTG